MRELERRVPAPGSKDGPFFSWGGGAGGGVGSVSYLPYLLSDPGKIQASVVCRSVEQGGL